MGKKLKRNPIVREYIQQVRIRPGAGWDVLYLEVEITKFKDGAVFRNVRCVGLDLARLKVITNATARAGQALGDLKDMTPEQFRERATETARVLGVPLMVTEP